MGSCFRVIIGAGDCALGTVSRREFPYKLTGPLLQEGQTQAGFHLRDPKILIVDDVVENGYLFQMSLERAGASSDFVSSGREALEMVQRHSYDLVLLDLQMPGMDGFSTLENLRAHGFNNPVFALTAHAMDEERQRALRAGFDG